MLILLITIACLSGAIRLVGSQSNSTQGRVEICKNNQWGTVCNNQWDINEAIVVCNQLGYYGNVLLIKNKTVISSSIFLLNM